MMQSFWAQARGRVLKWWAQVLDADASGPVQGGGLERGRLEQGRLERGGPQRPPVAPLPLGAKSVRVVPAGEETGAARGLDRRR